MVVTNDSGVWIHDIANNNGHGGGYKCSRFDTVVRPPPALYKVLNVLRKASRKPGAFATKEAVQGLICRTTEYSDSVGASDDLLRLLVDYGVILNFDFTFLFDPEAADRLLRACQEKRRLDPPAEISKRARHEIIRLSGYTDVQLERRQAELAEQAVKIADQLTRVRTEIERRAQR